MPVIDEIDRLARRRQSVWSGTEPDSSFEVPRITARLSDLYEQKRYEAARTSPARRVEVVRRARVESELERAVSEAPR